MKRILLAIGLVLIPQNAFADEVWLYTVNLDGVPKAGVTLTIENGESTAQTVTTDKYGRVKVDIVTSASSANLKISDGDIVRETVTFSWTDRERLAAGLIIPLWSFRDLKALSNKVAVSRDNGDSASAMKNVDDAINNEARLRSGEIRFVSHALPGKPVDCDSDNCDPAFGGPIYYAVAFRDPSEQGQPSIVLATTRGSLAHVNRWLELYVPNVPQASMPTLAKEIYNQLEPGDEVPAKFNDEMAELDRKIAGVNCRCASPLPQPSTTAYPFYNYRAPANGTGPVAIPQPYLRAW